MASTFVPFRRKYVTFLILLVGYVVNFAATCSSEHYLFPMNAAFTRMHRYKRKDLHSLDKVERSNAHVERSANNPTDQTAGRREKSFAFFSAAHAAVWRAGDAGNGCEVN